MPNTANIPYFIVNQQRMNANLTHNEALLEKVSKSTKIKAHKILLGAINFAGLAVIILIVIQNLKG